MYDVVNWYRHLVGEWSWLWRPWDFPISLTEAEVVEQLNSRGPA
jgi:hypothetical protein